MVPSFRVLGLASTESTPPPRPRSFVRVGSFLTLYSPPTLSLTGRQDGERDALEAGATPV